MKYSNLFQYGMFFSLFMFLIHMGIFIYCYFKRDYELFFGTAVGLNFYMFLGLILACISLYIPA